MRSQRRTSCDDAAVGIDGDTDAVVPLPRSSHAAHRAELAPARARGRERKAVLVAAIHVLKIDGERHAIDRLRPSNRENLLRRIDQHPPRIESAIHE